MRTEPRLPRPLLSALEAAGIRGSFHDRERSGALPAAPGAYLLFIGLDAPFRPEDGRFAGALFPAGRYLYAGSAAGPGGVRARAGRHLRANGKRRWHVDWLTHEADLLLAMGLEGANECALVAALERTGRFRHPLPGFGASDCRRCRSHLLLLR